MAAGFVADQGHGTVRPGEWVGGPPERSWLTGTRVQGKERYALVALRCADCGYVKLYAHPAAAAAHAYQELAERVERLEQELARLADRERFLVALLEGRPAAPAALRPGPAD